MSRGPVELVRALGAWGLRGLEAFGGMTLLAGSTLRWSWHNLLHPDRARRDALAIQMVRVGVRSIGIVCLVHLFMGVILALQLYRPLEEPWRQADKIANIIGVAGFRMLGPILTAVLLSGFAGASIAAELGTMVVAEEIEALEAHALNPVRFLVVPRVLATTVMMLALTVVADWMIAAGGYLVSRLVLGDRVWVGYWDRVQSQLRYRDFFSGLIMGGVFGLQISLISCYLGLKVRGGAEGVGRATTLTVVYSIVSIIVAACLFTMIFYVFKF